MYNTSYIFAGTLNISAIAPVTLVRARANRARRRRGLRCYCCARRHCCPTSSLRRWRTSWECQDSQPIAANSLLHETDYRANDFQIGPRNLLATAAARKQQNVNFEKFQNI